MTKFRSLMGMVLFVVFAAMIFPASVSWAAEDGLVILVVNDLLLEEIQPEINRLEADLESEGRTVKIEPWDTATQGAEDLRNYLKSEYSIEAQDLKGALFIGHIPYGSTWYADSMFWDMSSSSSPRYRNVWVSRMNATCYRGKELRYGSETVLLKRLLQACHDCRTGASRLPYTAYIKPWQGDGRIGPQPLCEGPRENALDIWPEEAIDLVYGDDPPGTKPLRYWKNCSYAFINGGEYMSETGHGAGNAYSDIYTRTIHNIIAQVRYAGCSSCHVGTIGAEGVVHNQTLTRGGGNILSLGPISASGFGNGSLLRVESHYSKIREALASGASYGDAIVYGGYFPTHMMFYGDISLPAKAAPHNEMPTVTDIIADTIQGTAPLTVNFSGGIAGDSDGSIALYEWFPESHMHGMAEPAAAGPSPILPAPYTYTLPRQYQARIEVADNYKARAWKYVNICVAPNPNEPLRVNCGRLFTSVYLARVGHHRYVPGTIPGFDYYDSQGRLWLHSQNYAEGTWGCTEGNSSYSRSGDVAGTEDDHLYQYLDYSNNPIAYTIPLTNGEYTVNLKFADMWNTSPGERLMDIYIEGELVKEAFDIAAVAGTYTATTVSRTVNLTDGLLEIEVEKNAASSKRAVLNCFEILPEGSPDNTPPVAVADADPATGNEPLDVYFQASASHDPDGFIAAYEWKLGAAVLSSEMEFSHTFTSHGIYDVTLKVTDDDGATDTDSVTITVDQPSSPVLTTIVVSPDPAELLTGGTQQFTAEGLDQYGDPIACDPVWTATGGTIDATGLYTAGDTAGAFNVAAADGVVEGSATVNISGQAQPGLVTLRAADQDGSNVAGAEIFIHRDTWYPAGMQVQLEVGESYHFKGKALGISGPYIKREIEASTTEVVVPFRAMTAQCRDQDGALVTDGLLEAYPSGEEFSDGGSITLPEGASVFIRARRLDLIGGYVKVGITEGLDILSAPFRKVVFRAMATDGTTVVPDAEIDIYRSGMARFANDTAEALPYPAEPHVRVYKDDSLIADWTTVTVAADTDVITIPTSWETN